MVTGLVTAVTEHYLFADMLMIVEVGSNGRQLLIITWLVILLLGEANRKQTGWENYLP